VLARSRHSRVKPECLTTRGTEEKADDRRPHLCSRRPS